MKKIIILVIIGAIAAAFFYYDLGTYFDFQYIKEQQAAFAEQYQANPVFIIGIFFLIYVVATAVSLPGAAILTLVAGALFGLVLGTIIVSFASTIGATLAFWASRYVLGESVQQKFGDRLKPLNDGIEKDGAFYLFSLRLVPVVPFFLINLLMGLTKIKSFTYFWVSQIGMLLGTIVYVNAGTQLAQIDSASGILTPAVLGSFVVLGIAPWIGKWVLSMLKRRRAYKGYTKPKSFDRNMVVIGGGSAGLVSAIIASTVKAKVTLVEDNKMGGDCLNYGCVPSKALIKSAKVAQNMRHADNYGLNKTDPSFSFKAVMQRVHDIIAAIEPHDSVERFEGMGVDVAQGYGKIIDPWTVEIKTHDGETKRLTTRSIVIASGAEPFVPPLPGLDDVGYYTSDTMWEEFAKMDEMPKRMVVLGGGPIGSELSQAFARLGADVTQVEMASRLLIREDEDVSIIAKEAQEKSGINVLTDHQAIRCELKNGEKHIIVKSGDKEFPIAFDALLVAVGRKARLTGFGLEELGIDTKGTVVTDEYLATGFPNIYAAGDVAGPYQFTHTASHQAWYASVNALFGMFRRYKADYRVIPWTTFIDPEVARVGLNEQEAKEQGVEYELARFELEELDRAITESATSGFIKLLVAKGSDKILGVTIVGSNAGEILAEYVLAMKHGLGLNKILGTIHTYPTMSEANKFVAGEWKKANKPEKLLDFVEKFHGWMRG